MRIAEICALPTIVKTYGRTGGGVHESVLRAHHVVEKVRELLRRGVPADVVVELIDEMTHREVGQQQIVFEQEKSE